MSIAGFLTASTVSVAKSTMAVPAALSVHTPIAASRCQSIVAVAVVFGSTHSAMRPKWPSHESGCGHGRLHAPCGESCPGALRYAGQYGVGVVAPMPTTRSRTCAPSWPLAMIADGVKITLGVPLAERVEPFRRT